MLDAARGDVPHKRHTRHDAPVGSLYGRAVRRRRPTGRSSMLYHRQPPRASGPSPRLRERARSATGSTCGLCRTQRRNPDRGARARKGRVWCGNFSMEVGMELRLEQLSSRSEEPLEGVMPSGDR